MPTTWTNPRQKGDVEVETCAILCPLYRLYQLRPVNYLLLGVFTIALGILVGLACAFSSVPTRFTNWIADDALSDFITGRVSLQSAIGTFVAVVCLTPYTLWAARRRGP
uniref:Uncharacterized protein n=1 Tax=Salix viminalis TaxID=40686 RepID=A0A6N2KNM8_SALVM